MIVNMLLRVISKFACNLYMWVFVPQHYGFVFRATGLSLFLFVPQHYGNVIQATGLSLFLLACFQRHMDACMTVIAKPNMTTGVHWCKQFALQAHKLLCRNIGRNCCAAIRSRLPAAHSHRTGFRPRSSTFLYIAMPPLMLMVCPVMYTEEGSKAR